MISEKSSTIWDQAKFLRFAFNVRGKHALHRRIQTSTAISHKHIDDDQLNRGEPIRPAWDYYEYAPQNSNPVSAAKASRPEAAP
jgi:hypothetical protein